MKIYLNYQIFYGINCQWVCFTVYFKGFMPLQPELRSLILLMTNDSMTDDSF
jgi:hypothetical protein